MRINDILPLSCILALLLTGPSHAAIRTASVDGDWNSAGTWSPAGLPAAGDFLVIPGGRTVTVTGNHSYTGAATRIQVAGTLFFNGGGSKLSLPCGSIVEIMSSSASISGNNSANSQSIKICGVTYWQVSDGPRSGYLVWPPNSTLPVELLGFTGEQEGLGVNLRWSTATESNSDRFEVWRERDGSRVLVGTVPAAGTTQMVQDYRLQDTPPTAGNWLYILVQHDLDGAAHSLPMIAVRFQTGGGLTCFPVPAEDEVSISLAEFPATLIVSDANGQVVLRLLLTSSLTRIPLADLPNGPYMAVTTHARGMQTERFVVMH